MEKSVEVAIEKISQLKLENKKLWEDRKKLLVEMKLKLPIKVKEYWDKRKELINAFDSSSKARQEVYLDFILDLYVELLADEKNKAVEKIFNKYKPFVQCQMINLNSITGQSQFHNRDFHELKLNNLLNSSKEGFNLQKEIKNIESEISEYENSTEVSQWIEDLKNLSESHLEALKIAEEWHLKGLETKIAERIKELNINKEKETQSLIE